MDRCPALGITNGEGAPINEAICAGVSGSNSWSCAPNITSFCAPSFFNLCSSDSDTPGIGDCASSSKACCESGNWNGRSIFLNSVVVSSLHVAPQVALKIAGIAIEVLVNNR